MTTEERAELNGMRQDIAELKEMVARLLEEHLIVHGYCEETAKYNRVRVDEQGRVIVSPTNLLRRHEAGDGKGMKEDMPRAYTADEVREIFLRHVWATLRYWNGLDKTCDEKLEGVVVSILATLDGEAGGLPGFVVAPAPHPDDRQYYIDEGENYYPEAPPVECDISRELHGLFYKYRG